MKNKTFGSALIIAGTTIGAGMLAMPLTSAKMGFGYTFLLLVILWALLSYSALLFVELYQKADSPDIGIATLAEQHFGMLGRVLASLSLIVFLYAILTAYISGAGGDLLVPFLSFLGEQAKTISILLFTIIFGVFVSLGAGSVDLLTRFLFLLKIVAFGFILVTMLPKITLQHLGALPLDSLLLVSAAPVFFTAFGFHGSIPSINKYLSGDIKALRIAIIVGTAIPLVAYTLWQAAIHGLFSQAEFVQIINQNPTLNGLAEAIHQSTGNAFIGNAFTIFSALALLTSFLGVALSLFDALEDLLKRVNIKANRTLLGLLTFIPPVIFALFYTDFLKALTYAGQMFTFYAIVLPVAMVWRLRKHFPELPYRVLGGNLGLIIALLLGLLIINVPFLIELGYFPNVN